MTIITFKTETLNLSTKFVEVTTPKGELVVDVKNLLAQPIHSDSAYFNATEIAKMYGKDLSNFTRTENYKTYLKLLNRDYHGVKFIKTVRGKHHGGTWFHTKMFLKFLLWVDIELEYTFHRFIEDLIVQVDVLKIDRQSTKTLFHPLTDTIKNIYIPNQKSENSKKFAYSQLLTMINIIALGCGATKYARDNNITIEKGKNIRDYLSESQLKQIEQLEVHLNGLIQYAKITDYQELKTRLNELKNYNK